MPHPPEINKPTPIVATTTYSVTENVTGDVFATDNEDTIRHRGCQPTVTGKATPSIGKSRWIIA